MRTIQFKIEKHTRIKDFLYANGFSGSLIKKLKQDKSGILKNKNPAKTIDSLERGDTLTVNIKSRGKRPGKWELEAPAQVKVLYKSEDLLAAFKPPGMPVHESANHRGDTLANALSKELDGAFRAVYRLDRDTSGIVIIAKNEYAASLLAGKIQKTYFAFAGGDIEKGGRIDLPVKRESGSIITRCVAPGGQRAVTEFEVLKRYGAYTLVKIRLETGRTHQIRVHFSAIGHPLLGDGLYGGNREQIKRQALHCGKVCFTEPVTGKRINLKSEFPDDMKELL